jgi:hypothetical protein
VYDLEKEMEMNGKKWIILCITLATVGLLAVATVWAGPALSDEGPARPQAPLVTSFTYQGRLLHDGSVVNNTCDFDFGLWDAETLGAQSGITQTISGVAVTDGYFTVELNGGGEFGVDAFDGDGRWLQIAVQCSGDAGHVSLGRQELTATPYAHYARQAPWSGLSGVPAGFADGVDNMSVVVSGTNVFAGKGLDQISAGNNITLSVAIPYRLPQVCVSGEIAEWNGSAWICKAGVSSRVWLLGGNAGTNSTTDVLGTTDAVSLTLVVDDTSALRLEPTAGTPNLVGGYRGNSVTGGARGATIGGGGVIGSINHATDDYATISGGYGNTASDSRATVGGGSSNTASGWSATVGGGSSNTASGSYAVVAGGRDNTADGEYSFAAGWRARANHNGAFVWADSTDADFASTGTDQFLVRATGGVSFTVGDGGLRVEPTSGTPNVVGGHESNSVTAGVHGATISGGGSGSAINLVTDHYGTVGGGHYNQAGDGDASLNDAPSATVGGGYLNVASDEYATVGGGLWNTASGNRATISGGERISATGDCAAVGGGLWNTVNGDYTTIGGGYYNTASGHMATVGGGHSNIASGAGAFVGGGGHNGSSGDGNEASGNASTIGGGLGNTASGNYAVVAGGGYNTAAGEYSFAAGRRAKANHAGTFVWADSADADFASTGDDQFLVNAGGGVGLGVNAPQNPLHVRSYINGAANAQNHITQIENLGMGPGLNVLALVAGPDDPADNVNFITFFEFDYSDIGAIEGDGAGGVTYKSGSGDYAEFLPRLDPDETLEPGDVVGVFGGRVSRSTQGADQLMVVSTRPIVLGNDPGEGNEAGYEKVAFLGQVEVRVRGPVMAGDFILPSGLDDGAGVAVAPGEITPEQFAQVVGQAWESSDELGVKRVRAVVGLVQHDPSVARMVGQIQTLEMEGTAQQAQIDELEARLAALEAALAALQSQGGE